MKGEVCSQIIGLLLLMWGKKWVTAYNILNILTKDRPEILLQLSWIILRLKGMIAPRDSKPQTAGPCRRPRRSERRASGVAPTYGRWGLHTQDVSFAQHGLSTLLHSYYSPAWGLTGADKRRVWTNTEQTQQETKIIAARAFADNNIVIVPWGCTLVNQNKWKNSHVEGMTWF